MADLGGHEGVRQAPLPGLPDLPGRPIVEDFAQQFSAAQKQTEAFLSHPAPAVRCCLHPTAGCSPSVCSSPRGASTSAPARPQQQPALWPQCGAVRRRPAQPASAPAKHVKRQGQAAVPETGDPEPLDPALQEMVTAPLLPPEEGRVENLLFPFCSVPKTSIKEQFLFPPGPKRARMAGLRDLVSTLPSPSLFASGQQGPVRGRDAFSRIPCPTMEPGQCHTTHSDPTSRRTAFRVGPLCSISLPHRGYVSNSPGPACTVPGGLARAPQAVSLAPEDYQTRLRVSVRPASPQVQGHSVHLSVEQGCPVLHAEVAVLLTKDAIEPVPPAEMKSGFYSPYFIVPKKDGGLRPILDLRVLNQALHKLPFRMLTQRRIFQCVRPFDWFAAIDLKDAYFHVLILPRHRPFLRFAFEGRAYQYKALPFGLSLSPRVFTKVVEAALVP